MAASSCDSDSDLSLDFVKFGADDFPFKNPLKRASKSCFFFWALAPRSGFGAAISNAAARSSTSAFCNSISGDRVVMAASRLLGSAAACVILLSFAAGRRQSYWNCCIKVAIVICQQIFSILALALFILKLLLNVLQNHLFFALAPRSGFGAAISSVFNYKKSSV